jgi:TolB protein
VVSGDRPAQFLYGLVFGMSSLGSDGRLIAFSDQEGAIAVVGADGGFVQTALSAPAALPLFRPNSKQLAAVTGRPGGDQAVVLVDLERPDWPRPLTPRANLYYSDLAWFPDRRRLVVAAYEQERMFFDHGTLLLVDLDDGRCETLVPGADRIWTSNPRPAPDGRSLVCVTDRDGWRGLWQLDLASGTDRRLLPQDGRGQLAREWSPDGRFLAFVSARAGDYRLAVLDVAGPAPGR